MKRSHKKKEIRLKNKNVSSDVIKENIMKKLQKAIPSTLQNTDTIMAVAILYENPRNMDLPQKHILANKMVKQYKQQGWIPHNLMVNNHTPVAMRRLIYGKEIREDAGLDTSGSNAILAEMLSGLLRNIDIKDTSAISFTGDSVALGQTYFAVIAK